MKMLKQFQTASGGLWVGGRATLTTEALIFEPDMLNRLVHAKGTVPPVEIPIAQIKDAKRRFDLFMGLVDVYLAGGTFSLRCYSARAFAEAIRKQSKPPNKTVDFLSFKLS
jgi:hypothetical protein